MAKYTGSEEDVKNGIYLDWFKKYKWETLGKIDFAVYGLHQDEPYYFLWAEAKKGDNHDIYDSFVQLILTVGKDRTFTKTYPPKYFGAFDAEKIAFIEYKELRDVFNQNDFDWTIRPSDHDSKEFKQLRSLLLDSIETNSTLFVYSQDGAELKTFIKNNFVIGLTEIRKILIDNNNFPDVFQKWYKDVFPTIEDFSHLDVMAGDFFLADLMDKSELSFEDKLRIVMRQENNVFYYKVKDKYIKKRDKFNFDEVNLGQKEYIKFWNKYERPPLDKYIQTIITRRDLLVLPDVRERKGSFFTPQIWVKMGLDYLRQALGNNWQDGCYIWDCCAGTGNLLADLQNGANLYASTLDDADVLIMKECLGNKIPKNQIFQFDFLKDDLQGDKVPNSLKDILSDPEERKKLVIFINPPYAEAGNKRQFSGTGKNKSGVSKLINLYDSCKAKVGLAASEMFSQFFFRIYEDIEGCILAQYSTLKMLQAPNFAKMRDYFLAELKGGFAVPADTFDNVKGQFPIGFMIWDTSNKVKFNEGYLDLFDRDGKCLGSKKFFVSNKKTIGQWLVSFNNKGKYVGCLNSGRTDFQNQNLVYIANEISQEKTHASILKIIENNLLVGCIYLSVRHCIPHTVWNHNDQFLYPNDGWKTDEEFQSNCLVFTLFHGKNRISSTEGTNHWIPFEPTEVGAKERYDSRFMIDFIKGKIGAKKEENLFDEDVDTQIFSSLPNKPIVFSEKAKKVMDAGKALWSYYHSKCGENPNASYYDIKMHFQKKNDKGKMNPKSEDDDKYNELHDRLKAAMKVLAKEIEVKVYEYGFLMK